MLSAIERQGAPAKAKEDEALSTAEALQALQQLTEAKRSVQPEQAKEQPDPGPSPRTKSPNSDSSPASSPGGPRSPATPKSGVNSPGPGPGSSGKGSQRPPSSDPRRLRVDRDLEWATETATRVCGFLEVIVPRLTGDPRDVVRASAAQGVVRLLAHCPVTLRDCMKVLIESTFTLAHDEMPQARGPLALAWLLCMLLLDALGSPTAGISPLP